STLKETFSFDRPPNDVDFAGGLMRIAALAALIVLALATSPLRAELIVHEWGTFTSLQDEDGKSIGGINVEDEPLPNFVHQLDPMLLIHANALPPVFYQGAPAAHPGVTMRLETPVIYFHPGGKGVAPAGRSDVTMRLETPVVYFHQD